MPPSVTTKGGTLALVMAVPWMRAAGEPDQRPRRAAPRPSHSPAAAAARAAKLPAALPLATMAAARPQKASSEPTDRSMPAVRMTKVMPIASRPEIDTCRSTLSRLMVDRKRGSAMAKTDHQHDEEDQRREAAPAGRTSRRSLRRARRRCGSALAVIAVVPQAARGAARVIRRIRRLLASPRRGANSPVRRPSHRVTMRSLSASTSGSSEEITITAMPSRASRPSS